MTLSAISAFLDQPTAAPIERLPELLQSAVKITAPHARLATLGVAHLETSRIKNFFKIVPHANNFIAAPLNSRVIEPISLFTFEAALKHPQRAAQIVGLICISLAAYMVINKSFNCSALEGCLVVASGVLLVALLHKAYKVYLPTREKTIAKLDGAKRFFETASLSLVSKQAESQKVGAALLCMVASQLIYSCISSGSYASILEAGMLPTLTSILGILALFPRQSALALSDVSVFVAQFKTLKRAELMLERFSSDPATALTVAHSDSKQRTISHIDSLKSPALKVIDRELFEQKQRLQTEFSELNKLNRSKWSYLAQMFSASSKDPRADSLDLIRQLQEQQIELSESITAHTADLAALMAHRDQEGEIRKKYRGVNTFFSSTQSLIEDSLHKVRQKLVDSQNDLREIQAQKTLCDDICLAITGIKERIEAHNVVHDEDRALCDSISSLEAQIHSFKKHVDDAQLILRVGSKAMALLSHTTSIETLNIQLQGFTTTLNQVALRFAVKKISLIVTKTLLVPLAIDGLCCLLTKLNESYGYGPQLSSYDSVFSNGYKMLDLIGFGMMVEQFLGSYTPREPREHDFEGHDALIAISHSPHMELLTRGLEELEKETLKGYILDLLHSLSHSGMSVEERSVKGIGSTVYLLNHMGLVSRHRTDFLSESLTSVPRTIRSLENMQNLHERGELFSLNGVRALISGPVRTRARQTGGAVIEIAEAPGADAVQAIRFKDQLVEALQEMWNKTEA